MVHAPADGGRLIRVAFTMLGGAVWTGGFQYLLNLLRVVGSEAPGRIKPVVFFGGDFDASHESAFRALPDAEMVRTNLLDRSRQGASLLRALIMGRDPAVARLFASHGVDVVFEAAQFFGWRLGIPALAWIPDLQHRYLPHLFGRFAYWKRDVGYRAQIAGGRLIMLSSEDSRRSCEHFYPRARGHTTVVRFAVPPPSPIDRADARRVADEYSLPANFFYLPNQFWQHKDHRGVVEALALLRARGRTDIVVAASGNTIDARRPAYFEELTSLVRQRQVEGQFRVLGLVPREHLARLMIASDALLNPSLFEGWSTTVEEARALGVPLVLSDLEVHREQAGDTARYFRRGSPESMADALANFVPPDLVARDASAKAARLAAAGRLRTFAEEFVAAVERAAHRPGAG